MNHKREQERIAELKAEGNKHFIVTIYNLFCQNEKRYEDVYAMDSKEAEKIAIGGGLVNLQNGWGVLGSREVLDDYSCLTPEQVKGVKSRIDKLLKPIVSDAHDRSNMVEAMLEPICEDISCAADWSDFEADEYCLGDIDIAIARLLRDKICE